MLGSSALFNLSGRTAVVTGASSGLSQAIAVGFAEYGADVVAADINEEGLKTTVEQITAAGRKGLAVHCDITQPEQVKALFETVDKSFDHVDILLNGPYAFARAKPEDLTLDEWNRAISVCLTGFFMCSQEAGRRMINQETGGSIINIGSIGGVSAL
jgi:NAD(P)-dependent dehydrogenase (short-subunit alcohol dehydrogenase family)